MARRHATERSGFGPTLRVRSLAACCLTILICSTGLAGSEPMQFQLTFQAPGTVYAIELEPDRGLMYMGDYRRMCVFDIDDPLYPKYIGNTGSLPSAVVGLASKKARSVSRGSARLDERRFAFAAQFGLGVQVLDVTDPTSPYPANDWDTPGAAVALVVREQTLYIADRERGLRIVDVTDPLDQQPLGSLDTTGMAWGLDVVGRYAYVADLDGGLLIIDVSDPQTPTLVSSTDTGGQTYNVRVRGHLAYVVDLFGGLRILDVTSAESPTIVGSYDFLDAFDLDVSGCFAYVAAAYGGLYAFDISNPADPVAVGHLFLPGPPPVFFWDVRVVGDALYLGLAQSGMAIFQVSILGDVNGDLTVNLLDLAIVLANYNCSKNCDGDADGDGVVDFADLATVLTYYGLGCN